MVAMNGFDASAVEPSRPLEPLPAGDYICAIVQSELKKSNGGDDMLAIELQVLEGQHKGCKLFDRCMRSHSNPQVVRTVPRHQRAATTGLIAAAQPTNQRDGQVPEAAGQW
jgi:hypothetical protein